MEKTPPQQESLKREASGERKPPQLTVRSLVTKYRNIWWRSRQLQNLTVEQLRSHLVMELEDLELTPEELPPEYRKDFLAPLRKVSLPVDPRFWQVLQDVEQQEARSPGALGRSAEETQLYLHECFALKCEGPVPQEWELAGFYVLLIRDRLRGWGRQLIAPWVARLRKRWERGDEQALLGAVRIGMFTEEWVARAMADLVEQTVVGKTTEERDRAKKILEQAGKALADIGKGRTKEVTPAMALQIRETYSAEHTFCQQFKRASKKHWRTRQERHRDLANLFNMTPEEVIQAEEQAHLLKPSEWARQRTAAKTGFSEETVRRALLDTPPTKRV